MQATVAVYRYRCACAGCACTRESVLAPARVGFAVRADGSLLCAECAEQDAGHEHTYAVPAWEARGARLFVGGDVI